VAAGLLAERHALSADATYPVVSAGNIFLGLGAIASYLIQSTFFATAVRAALFPAGRVALQAAALKSV
jgi:hypothetical protein